MYGNNVSINGKRNERFYQRSPSAAGYLPPVRGNKSFMDSVEAAAGRVGVCKDTGNQEMETWEEKLKRFDEELDRIKKESEREHKRLQEERIRKKKIQKKLLQKLIFKKYLARQFEIHQLNEKIALERAVGEDVYIEKPPLSKSLSLTEIMAICSEA